MSSAGWSDDPDLGIVHWFIEANGIKFELAECGSGGRLALCLHGFPELNHSWRYQMPVLAQAGWRVWAPNLRGYGGTTRPPSIRDYAVDHLTQDVAALIDASGAREVMLIAHDWGAIIAWNFAIRKVRPLVKLVIMNVPHPKVAQRELRHWRQIRRSWYIYFFQLPWLPERVFSANNARVIRGAFYKMAVDKSRFPRELLKLYADAALKPGAMTAMMNYYRAMFRHRGVARIGKGICDTPTLMIWGEQDSALNILCTEGTEQWVPDFELHRLPNVSHWVQQEAPEKVNQIMLDWLKRRP